MRKTQQGQAMVEFGLIAIVLLVLIFAVIDLARAGFMQHDLDAGASDLASKLAQISGTSSNNGNPDVPNISTRLDPTNSDTIYFSTDPSLDPSLAISMTVSQAMQKALDHAAQIASYNFSASPLTMPVSTTLQNGQVTVVGTPYLTSTITSTTELTVTITAPFTPVVGFYLHNAVLHLQARASVRTPAGQLAP